MKMRYLWTVLFAVCLQAHASSTLFSDLGTGGSVYTTGPGSNVQGSGVGGNSIEQARPFTVSGTGSFDVTQIDLGVVIDAGNGQFQASIWTDSGNKPGTELSSWDLTTTVAYGSCCGLTTQTGITGLTLDGGTEYFMVLAPPTPTADAKDEWELNSTGANSLILGSITNGSTWISDGTGANLAFDVLGDPAPAATPEPNSLIQLATGLLALMALALRKRERAAPINLA